MISENDPKATPANIARVRREFVHPTLLQEYDDQSPFLSKGALEMFERRSKEESENTDDVGFVRFVNVFDIAKFRRTPKKEKCSRLHQRQNQMHENIKARN